MNHKLSHAIKKEYEQPRYCFTKLLRMRDYEIEEAQYLTEIFDEAVEMAGRAQGRHNKENPVSLEARIEKLEEAIAKLA